MGIQPIDLQTMYSQLSNVSKMNSVQSQAALTEAMQQQNNINKNIENSSKVQHTSSEKSTSDAVRQDGHNGQSFAFEQNKKKKESEESSENNESCKPKDSDYLGTIIDITR